MDPKTSPKRLTGRKSGYEHIRVMRVTNGDRHHFTVRRQSRSVLTRRMGITNDRVVFRVDCVKARQIGDIEATCTDTLRGCVKMPI